jgi:plastocyanin
MMRRVACVIGCWALFAVAPVSLTAKAALAAGQVTVEVRDEGGAPVEGAVVVLEGGPAGTVPVPAAQLVMDQVDEQFSPQIMVVPRGSGVVFKNSDTTRHHIYSFRPPKRFELQLAPGEISPPVTFEEAGIVALGCNIHDHMRAHLYVTAAPFVARTGKDGVAVLTGVPAAAWTLKAWHPRLPAGTPETEQAVTSGPDRTAVRVALPVRAERPAGRDPERARY